MIRFHINKRVPTLWRLVLVVMSSTIVAGVALAYTGPNRPDIPPTRWRGRGCGFIIGGNFGCCTAEWNGNETQFRPSVCGGWANPNDCDCRDFNNFTSVSVGPLNGGPQPPATHSSSFGCANPGNSGWCVSGPSIDFSADEPLSGYEISAIEGDSGILCGIGAQSGSCTWNIPFPDGAYTENHWALATYGDTSALRTTNYRIDGTPPSLVESVPAPDGSNGWYVTPPTLSVAGTDATSGYDRGEVQVGDSWFSSPHTVSADGVYAIDFRTFDMAGNMTNGGATSISLDTTPPSINPQVIGDQSAGFFGKNVTLVVGGVDATSGIVAEEVSIDGGSWEPPGNFLLPDSDHIIAFRAVDVAGNVITDSISISVDGTDPALNVSALAGACIHGIHTFRGQIVEDPANLAFAKFLLDGSVLGQLNPDRGGQWFFDVNTEKEGDGIYQISVYAEDLAGNKGSSKSIIVTIDNTAPFIELWDRWDAKSYGLLEVEDAFSGLQEVDITVKGEGLNKKFNFKGDAYPQTLYISDFLGSTRVVPPAEVSLEVIATDLCGNRTEASSQVVFRVGEEPHVFVQNGGEAAGEKTPSADPMVEESALASLAEENTLQLPKESELATQPAEVTAASVSGINWRVTLPVFVLVFFTGLRVLFDPLPAAWKRRAEQHETWLEKYPEFYLESFDEF